MQKTLSSSLVTIKWMKDLLKANSSKYKILDASWHLPNTGRKAALEFTEKHIPGALFFDIDECADKATDLPHMIPSPEVMEDYVGSLGITNDTHVIVYDNNSQFPLFSAQRVWWTFRLFGHNQISILEGGLPKWIAEDGPVTKEVTPVLRENFKAKFNNHLVKSMDDIKRNLEKPEFQLVDARPEGRFKGISPEPRDDTKPGSIPNSLNIPFMSTMNLEERTMKSPEEIKKLFQDSGVDLDKPFVVSCGSGISACVLALAAHMIGKDDIAVYDGSWTEWYHRAPPHLKQNVPA